MASNRSRATNSVGNKLNSLDSRVARNEKGTNNPHLSPNVIEEQHIKDSSVSESKIGDRAITENKIARGAVGTEHLGIVNTITADSGLTLKTGSDGGYIVIDGEEYQPPALGSGALFSLAYNELRQVVVSTSGGGGAGGDGVDTSTVPAGLIQAWPTNAIPDGWLLCDGQAVSRTTYSYLFSILGTTYGAGNGTTTFNLPNIKGKTIVGRDTAQTEFDTIGKIGGDKSVILQASQIPAHSHPNTLGGTTSFATSNHTHGSGGYHAAIGATNNNIAAIGYVAGGVVSGGPTTSTYTITGGIGGAQTFNHYTPVYGSSSAASASASVTLNNADNTGGGGAHTNLQPYITLNYIIKTSPGTVLSDPVLLSRVADLENTKANLSGASFTGNVSVNTLNLRTTGAIDTSSGTALALSSGTGVVTLNGSVRMPNQPTYYGYFNAYQSGTVTNYFPITTNVFNVGFSRSGNNRLTVQSAGKYYVAAQQLVNTAGVAVYFTILKNGATIAYAYSSADDTYDVNVSVLLDMAVNDYVEVYYSGSTTYTWGNPHSSYSVFKVS